MPKSPKRAKKYNPLYYHFDLAVSEYGVGVTAEEIMRVLKPFFNIVEVRGVRKPYEEEYEE